MSKGHFLPPITAAGRDPAGERRSFNQSPDAEPDTFTGAGMAPLRGADRDESFGCPAWGPGQ